MNDFFAKKNCDRCGGELKEGRILSMFNTQVLCLQCKEKETKHPDYDKAVQADHAEIKKGNYNFKGINRKFSKEQKK